MPKIKLEVISNSSFIKAPNFCPYKITDFSNSILKIEGGNSGIIEKIHPSMCSVCKYCTFISEIDYVEGVGLSEKEKEKYVRYLTEINTKASSSLIAQKQYLVKNDRLPLIILLSPSYALQAFQYIFSPNLDKAKEIFNYYLFTEIQICIIFSCPVYIARRLAKSQLQLVGEITWK